MFSKAKRTTCLHILDGHSENYRFYRAFLRIEPVTDLLNATGFRVSTRLALPLSAYKISSPFTRHSPQRSVLQSRLSCTRLLLFVLLPILPVSLLGFSFFFSDRVAIHVVHRQRRIAEPAPRVASRLVNEKPREGSKETRIRTARRLGKDWRGDRPRNDATPTSTSTQSTTESMTAGVIGRRRELCSLHWSSSTLASRHESMRFLIKPFACIDKMRRKISTKVTVNFTRH